MCHSSKMEGSGYVCWDICYSMWFEKSDQAAWHFQLLRKAFESMSLNKSFVLI